MTKRRFSKTCIAAIACAFGLVCFSGKAVAVEVTYQDFSATTGLTLNGSAVTVTTSAGLHVLRIVPAASYRAGSFFSSTQISVADQFSTYFVFRLSNPGGVSDGIQSGADGFVFVVQPVSSSIGSAGGCMGYCGINPSVGVEFDIYRNSENADPGSNHLGINVNGSAVSSPVVSVSPRWDNGSPWYAWVDYDGTTLEVRANQTGVRPVAPLLSKLLDISSLIGTMDAYVGFTAGTGAAWANHDIESWTYRDFQVEYCDGIDNDVNGTIDEGCDDDGDGYCDESLTLVGSPPVCTHGGGDCDDSSADVYPGAPELCDDLDNQCPADSGHGELDEGCDDDGDGYCDDSIPFVGTAAICPNGGGDCDDLSPMINPGAAEVCDDSRDNDCNQLIDVADPACFASCTPMPFGAISWWPGEASAADAINGNHGMLVNGLGFEPGIVGQAFSFDGIDDHVRVADDPSLDLRMAITAEAWVKRGNNGTAIVVFKRRISGNTGYGFSVRPNGGLLATVYGRFDHYSPTGLVQPDAFVHVAWTYDSMAGQSRIYVDGALVSAQVHTTVISTNDQPLYIGRAVAASGQVSHTSGATDEIGLYGRALTPEEITTIYAAGGAGKCVVGSCGNAICEIGENAVICPSDCVPMCGNGFVEPGEQCDDGNITDDDGCDRSCNIEPTCGDGIADLGAGEECDDGNLVSGDCCSSSCLLEGCAARCPDVPLADCTEEAPCDVLSPDHQCDPVDVVAEDTLTIGPPQGDLCPDAPLRISRTRLGSVVETRQSTEEVCSADCYVSCFEGCVAVPIQECYDECTLGCANGLCLWWERKCSIVGQRSVCDSFCYEECETNYDEVTGQSFYTETCGHLIDDSYQVRRASGTCSGEIVDEGSIVAHGTGTVELALPVEPGSYEVCDGTNLLKSFYIRGDCPPSCVLKVDRNRLSLDAGQDGQLGVELANRQAGGTYMFSLLRFEDDGHTIPMSVPPFLVIPDPAVVDPDATLPFDLLADNPQPVGSQEHWGNVILRAEGPDVQCEIPFDVDVISCGNGVVDGDEDCDDGGETASCDDNCTLRVCGDGDLNSTAGEECDDGNVFPSDGCENCLFVPPCPDLSITTSCPGGVPADTPIDLTVTVINQGGAEADDVHLLKSLPSGAIIHSATCANGGECAIDPQLPNSVDCNLGTILPDESNLCTLSVSFPAAPFCNQYLVSSTSATSSTGECNVFHNEAECILHVDICPPRLCPNGAVDPTEECDDNNDASGDGCDANCTETRCGNGIVTDPEECDDKNTQSGDGCSSECHREGECGDSILDPGEECDDGNQLNGDGCDFRCRLQTCGNGVAEPGESCDEEGESATCNDDCTRSVCGDGRLNVTDGEQCDHRGESAACDVDCTVAQCGDGTLNVTAQEQCDDAGESAACDVDCTFAQCGDGITNTTAGEACDGGGESFNCDDDCTPVLCGDGNWNASAGEECDDGNNLPGDMCAPDCQRPLVFVVPGILGSALVSTSGDVKWLDPFAVDNSMIDLVLPDSSCPPDCIEATSIFDCIPFTPFSCQPGVWWDFYGQLMDSLENMGYRAIPFPYDWRLDLEETAFLFHEFIAEELLHRNRQDPVAVVAHSLGTAVTRRLVVGASQDEYSARSNYPLVPVAIGSAVYLAPPFSGTAMAPQPILTGQFDLSGNLVSGGNLLDALLLDEIAVLAARSWPAVYQTLPLDGFFVDSVEDFKSCTDLRRNYPDRVWLRAGLVPVQGFIDANVTAHEGFLQTLRIPVPDNITREVVIASGQHQTLKCGLPIHCRVGFPFPRVDLCEKLIADGEFPSDEAPEHAISYAMQWTCGDLRMPIDTISGLGTGETSIFLLDNACPAGGLPRKSALKPLKHQAIAKNPLVFEAIDRWLQGEDDLSRELSLDDGCQRPGELFPIDGLERIVPWSDPVCDIEGWKFWGLGPIDLLFHDLLGGVTSRDVRDDTGVNWLGFEQAEYLVSSGYVEGQIFMEPWGQAGDAATVFYEFPDGSIRSAILVLDGDPTPWELVVLPSGDIELQRDVDGDGVPDQTLPFTEDRDGDGIPDEQDNCPDLLNPVQADQDGDQLGDVCDSDDCDSATAENPGTTICGVGECERTVTSCIGGVTQTCLQGNPSAEICDGLDNDCDGSIDEDLGSTTCGLGECARTVENCVVGVPQVCIPGEPSIEYCDGLDNNCDGEIDQSDICCNPVPVGQGSWHRQCLGAGLITPGRNGQGRGPTTVLEPDFLKVLVPAVNVRLQNTVMEFRTCEDGIHTDPPSDKCEKALKQYTSFLLNIESGHLADSCAIDVSAAGCVSNTTADLVMEIAGLINAGDDASCNLASSCASAMNENEFVSPTQSSAAPDGTADAVTQIVGAVVATGDSSGASEFQGQSASVEVRAPGKLGNKPLQVEEDALSTPVMSAIAGSIEAHSFELSGEEPEGASRTLSVTGPDEARMEIEKHLESLSSDAASEIQLRASRDALLTALGGGYEASLRLKIVRTLMGKVDVAYHSLLIKHLEDIRLEAKKSLDANSAEEATRILDSLEASRDSER